MRESAVVAGEPDGGRSELRLISTESACRRGCAALLALILRQACLAEVPSAATPSLTEPSLTDPAPIARLIDAFNRRDDEAVVNAVANARAYEWIAANAPRFECPSSQLTETYYFRWWSYRKHIKQTSVGRVVTEFLVPVSHAGDYNTISCAFGHHLAEGRWLRDQSFLDEYVRFWFHGGEAGGPAEHFHKFSSWAAASLYDRYLVTGDRRRLVDLLDDLIADYALWEAERLTPEGLFWQYDVRDGMEESISGSRTAKHLRPTINCYMAANARAISRIAHLASRADVAARFAKKSDDLISKLHAATWDANAEFFKVRLESGELSDAREAIGYLPWTFGVAQHEHASAWREIRDPAGFMAPRGLTTAERRHPAFRTHGTGTCEWDGAVWPFATSQTLVGLANVLRGPPQPYVTRRDFFDQLLRYAAAHQQDGEPYIGEYHDEKTGAWLITGPKAERGRFYNHSTFADLVIAGLVGIVPREDDQLEVSPLVPVDAWDWFCLEDVPYRGHAISVVWDRDGARYNCGRGLSLWCDGVRLACSPTLQRITAPLPPPAKAE